MNIYWMSLKDSVPSRGYWDQHILAETLEECQEVSNLDGIEECIVVIPGAYQFELIDEINREISKLKKVIVIITSDEENRFPIDKLQHDNIEIYATYPHDTTKNVKWLPIGYTPHTKKEGLAPKKILDVFYQGQINHIDRQEMYNELKNLENVNAEIVPTKGFADGSRIEYIEKMSNSKVVPAPKGNISYDSFRLYEAMELGAIPIAQKPSFWDKLYKDVPFPVIEKKEQWRGYIYDAIKDYPVKNNRIQAWWQRKKIEIKHDIIGYKDMTVIIPISPIPSHPSTEIIDMTIKSIKRWTDSEIWLLFDGVRQEQEEKRSDYEEFIRNVLWKYNEYPIIFDNHTHQSGMMKNILPKIKTPLLMFIEQDTPLVEDELIEIDKIKQFILSGQSNLVRFYHEAFIHPDHKHLMLNTQDDFTETAQWSQRPHIASTAFYSRIMSLFSDKTKSFIEDYIHGKEYEDFIHYGYHGWNQWKTHLYTPKGNIKRSLHSDGRAGSKKFDKNQIW